MKRYKVIFEFRNDYGEWMEDYLNNNDNGFAYDEAVARYIEIVEI